MKEDEKGSHKAAGPSEQPILQYPILLYPNHQISHPVPMVSEKTHLQPRAGPAPLPNCSHLAQPHRMLSNYSH